MPATAPRVFSNIVAVGGVPVNVTETVVATSPRISTQGAAGLVRLLFTGEITLGASQTSVALKVERGTAAGGTQVGTTVTPVGTAATKQLFSVYVEDTPGDVGGQQYVLTATQAGGAGNGASANVSCLALVD